MSDQNTTKIEERRAYNFHKQSRTSVALSILPAIITKAYLQITPSLKMSSEDIEGVVKISFSIADEFIKQRDNG